MNKHTNLDSLQDQLGYRFNNKHLLNEALTHRSCAKPYNNERLEFLGDALMGLLVGEYVFSNFPNHKEGQLSKMRSSLVNEESFASIARGLFIGENLILSSSEEQNNGRHKPSLLADAFEAIMGAIYIEAGFNKAKEIVWRILDKHCKEFDVRKISDYKTALQELTQSRFGEIPSYELIYEKGPDHNKEFCIRILVCGEEYARALGNSKKSTQQICAKIAYNILEKTNPKKQKHSKRA